MQFLWRILLSLYFLFGTPSFAVQTTTITVVEKPGSTTTLSGQHATPSPVLLDKTSTSVVQATKFQPTSTYAAPVGSATANGGASSSNTNSFSLGTGGLVAIIVVVAAVLVIGIASTVLFVVAKRRQWKIRDSIKRASRRLTGRRDRPSQRDAERRKRSGMMPSGKTRAGTTIAYPPGQKRGVVVAVHDEEKGQSDMGGDSKRGGWSERLRGNNRK